MNLTKYSIFN